MLQVVFDKETWLAKNTLAIEFRAELYVPHPAFPPHFRCQTEPPDLSPNLQRILELSRPPTSNHCREAVKRARGALFQVRSGFAVLSPEIFRPLYLALVTVPRVWAASISTLFTSRHHHDEEPTAPRYKDGEGPQRSLK